MLNRSLLFALSLLIAPPIVANDPFQGADILFDFHRPGDEATTLERPPTATSTSPRALARKILRRADFDFEFPERERPALVETEPEPVPEPVEVPEVAPEPEPVDVPEAAPETDIVESVPPDTPAPDVAETVPEPAPLPAPVVEEQPAPTPVEDVVQAEPPPKKKRKKSAVPPGFESLLEPQITMVDVYYGGLFIQSTTASFTPTDIEFLEPDAIVARLNDILDPKALIESLRVPLPTNSELICMRRLQTQCGEIATDSVAVIFDDSRFRVDLFLGQELLAVRPAVETKFLPPSDGESSLMQLFNLSLSGTESELTDYNLTTTTTLGYRESRLFALGNFTMRDRLTFDTIAYQHEINGREVQVGLFRNDAGMQVFSTDSDFAGILIGSSLDTRKDLDQSTGNDLQLFLPRRSRVDILKDDRLVSSRVYDTGNQIIDTSELPGGAYDIVLRIRDNLGQTREETRFYVKTNRLPPLDQSLYYIEAGRVLDMSVVRTVPEISDEKLFRAGISKRFTQGFGGQLGYEARGEDSMLEAGIFLLGRRIEFRSNAAMDEDGDYGVNMTSRLRLGNLSMDSALRRVWSDRHLRGDRGILGTKATQASINLNYPIGKNRLALSARYNDRLGQASDRSTSLRFDFAPRRLGASTLESDLEITKNNDRYILLLAFRYRTGGQRWQTELAPEYQYIDSADGTEGNARTNLTSYWQDQDKYLSDVSFSFGARSSESGSSLQSDLVVASNRGRVTLDATYNRSLGVLDYSGSFATSFMANGGTITMGGQRLARSAIIVDIDGDVDNAHFNVLVDRNPKGVARIGEKTIIGLSPYKTYGVQLVSKGEAFVDFNQGIQSVTLYPGNVVTLNWATKEVIIVFGQILDEGGEPVPNALIEGVVGLATTDDFGLFQAELESSVRSLNVRTRDSACAVELPAELEINQSIALLGEMTCR